MLSYSDSREHELNRPTLCKKTFLEFPEFKSPALRIVAMRIASMPSFPTTSHYLHGVTEKRIRRTPQLVFNNPLSNHRTFVRI